MSTLTRNPVLAGNAPPGALARAGESEHTHTSDSHAAHAGVQEARLYRGRTVDELIPRIVSELGEDAIVISHHSGLTGGFAGFFQRPFVEIEACRGSQGGQLLDRYDEDDAPALPGDYEDSRDWDEPREIFATNPFAEALAEAEAAVRAAEPAVPPDLDAALAAALAEAEAAGLPAEPTAPTNHDTALADTISLPRVQPHDLPPLPTAPIPRGRAENAPARTPLERALLEVGFDEQLVGEVIEAATAHLLPLIETGMLAEPGTLAETGMLAGGERLPASVEGECLLASVGGECLPASVEDSSPAPSASALAQAVRLALQQRIPVCPPLPPGSATIALVGPGGSGKSVCCATLLDAYHRRSTLPAACATFVSNPTRPAGEELEVVLGPHVPEPARIDDPGAAQALRSAREEGLLLLDTPPLSPADHAAIGALAATLQRLRPDRVVLALPATLGAKPAARLLEAYRPLGTSALAITHTDETDQLGVVVEVACAFGLAPAYLLERDGSRWGLAQIDPADLLDRLLPAR